MQTPVSHNSTHPHVYSSHLAVNRSTEPQQWRRVEAVMRNPQVAAAGEDEEELRVGDRQKSGARRKHAHGGMGQQDVVRVSLGGPFRNSGACGEPRSASVLLPLSVESSPWRSCISCLRAQCVSVLASVCARVCACFSASCRGYTDCRLQITHSQPGLLSSLCHWQKRRWGTLPSAHFLWCTGQLGDSPPPSLSAR